MGLALLVASVPALAQTYELAAPKTVGEQSMMYEWIYGLVFLAGCLVAGFKPSKRSNLK